MEKRRVGRRERERETEREKERERRDLLLGSGRRGRKRGSRGSRGGKGQGECRAVLIEV